MPPLWLAGQVGPQDTAGLEMYCSAYARWREALAQVEAGGLVVEGGRGAAPSPWLRVLQEAEVQVARWVARFGLSTKDRAAMGESLRAIAAAKVHTDQAAAAAKPKPTLAVSNG